MTLYDNEIAASERDEQRWSGWRANHLADTGAPRITAGIYRTGDANDDR